jgi:hypothetical protein
MTRYRLKRVLVYVLTGKWRAAWKWTTGEWPRPVLISRELMERSSVNITDLFRNRFDS